MLKKRGISDQIKRDELLYCEMWNILKDIKKPYWNIRGAITLKENLSNFQSNFYKYKKI